MAPTPNATDESPLPLNAAGVAAWRGYDPQLSPANTCEPISMPGILYAPYLNDIEIREGEVFFHHEATPNPRGDLPLPSAQMAVAPMYLPVRRSGSSNGTPWARTTPR